MKQVALRSIEMNIQKIEITKLKPAEYNPRKDLKPEDEEYQKIKRSIIEFGYVAPVIVNSDMTVIGGHQRLKVLKELGYNEVECVVVDLNKNKEKALNIALNKISGDWDNSKLEELLAELKETDIDLDITGFSFDEVDNILKDITGSKEDDFDIQQALDEIDEPITKTGDIWILGKHRLMCGDSTIIDNVYKLTNKEKVKVLFTDPPYNMAFNGRSGNFDVIKNDDLDKKGVFMEYYS
jgi:ParB-like chromosome segregation protein Spo0J